MTIVSFKTIRHVDIRRFYLRIRQPFVIPTSSKVHVVKADWSERVAPTRHHYDSTMPLARARGQQQGLQQLEEQKMPEMVRAHLQLEAIGSPAFRTGDDASIRNKDIYPITSHQKVRFCSTHAGQVTQVHEKKLDPATAFTGAENVLDDCLAFRFVADGKE